MRKRLASLVLTMSLLAGLTALCPEAAASAGTLGGFADVPADAWYREAVEYCQSRGILQGYGQNDFLPDGPMTRAQLAVVLFRMSGTPAGSVAPNFTDARPGHWYSDAVAWAVESGVILGYGNSTFGVDFPTTREQAVTILWRYAGSPAASVRPGYSDLALVSPWAAEAVRWAAAEGLLTGMTADGRFRPQENVRRCEMAALFYGYLEGKSTAGTEESLLYLDVKGRTLTARWADNSSARALRELLAQGPLTLVLEDYAGMEKVGPLGTALPENKEQMTTQPGDLVLHQGNQFVIYYSTNTWSLTPLGRLTEAGDLKALLGEGAVQVTLRLE